MQESEANFFIFKLNKIGFIAELHEICQIHKMYKVKVNHQSREAFIDIEKSGEPHNPFVVIYKSNHDIRSMIKYKDFMKCPVIQVRRYVFGF